MAAAFFYGTLMHPKILQRVIGNDGSHLQICPALLPDYTRHRISAADYPGIVAYAQSRAMFDHDLELEERCVRGSLVTGLSDDDIRLLDIFEGNEYTRDLVSVHPLGPFSSLNDMPPVDANALFPAKPPPVSTPSELQKPLEANTYVWCRPLSELRADLWTFEEFVKQSAWKWIGSGSEGNRDYAEVDRRRAMEGIIVRS
ncbi:hypothetical protein HYDPIDRAFT_103800 [Hydnomerulius pinastri MD-312]|uniref:Putative gamma-glutamylcyclotransferase n=1 Tax=Hydnomerulius pinastri MD-312 TaxID=994086 RepID=A0A0C9UXR0_9AGAM|nr:hypothetical protein HYDPIDRAFT_103800 [Hydnomerulius pinastri MD-312]